MSSVSVRIVGKGFPRFKEAVDILGEGRLRKAYATALNDAGKKTKTGTARALAKQTNLKVGTTKKALQPKFASAGSLEFALHGEGGNISLKFFSPKETGGGVQARPWGSSTVYPGSFLAGGRWPGGRKGLIAGGHAFYRGGKGRTPISRAKSGLFIPTDMVKGATASTFEQLGTETLETRIAHQIKRATKGAVT